MSSKKDHQYWDQRNRTIFSRKGGWELGKGITLHGYSLLDDLVGTSSFFQVLILGITGKLPEERIAKWTEATFLCMSWPDPRIWCNQVSTFGGELRTSNINAVAAGMMSSESMIYGPLAGLEAVKFIHHAYEFTLKGGNTKEFIETVATTRAGLKAPGYGRPIAKGDERVAAMINYAQELGFDEGPHLKLALEIEEHLLTTHQESLNLAGYMAAFGSDLGYSISQLHRIITMCVSGGLHSCFAESRDQPSDSFLPLRCDDLKYTGPEERTIEGNENYR